MGDFSAHYGCEKAAINFLPATAWTYFDSHFPDDKHGNEWKYGCYVRIDNIFKPPSEKHCSSGQVINSTSPTPRSPAPKHPSPSPQAPAPKHPSPSPQISPTLHFSKLPGPPITFAAVSGKNRLLATNIRSDFYFLPTPGTNSRSLLRLSGVQIAEDGVSSIAHWDELSISNETGIMSFLNGPAFAGIESQDVTAQHDFLVVAGGKGTRQVVAYDVQMNSWNTSITPMEEVSIMLQYYLFKYIEVRIPDPQVFTMFHQYLHVCMNSAQWYPSLCSFLHWVQNTYDFCAIGCEGYAFMANGVLKGRSKDQTSIFKQQDALTGMTEFKPANRQIYRYNFTSGQVRYMQQMLIVRVQFLI